MTFGGAATSDEVFTSPKSRRTVSSWRQKPTRSVPGRLARGVRLSRTVFHGQCTSRPESCCSAHSASASPISQSSGSGTAVKRSSTNSVTIPVVASPRRSGSNEADSSEIRGRTTSRRKLSKRIVSETCRPSQETLPFCPWYATAEASAEADVIEEWLSSRRVQSCSRQTSKGALALFCRSSQSPSLPPPHCLHIANANCHLPISCHAFTSFDIRSKWNVNMLPGF